MTLHRYSLGQTVRFTSRTGQMLQKTPNAFEVVGLLPPRDGTYQYRIRSGEERHERVALEDDLEAIESRPARKQADNSNIPGAIHQR